MLAAGLDRRAGACGPGRRLGSRPGRWLGPGWFDHSPTSHDRATVAKLGRLTYISNVALVKLGRMT
jgi:hypothetical protein